MPVTRPRSRGLSSGAWDNAKAGAKAEASAKEEDAELSRSLLPWSMQQAGSWNHQTTHRGKELRTTTRMDWPRRHGDAENLDVFFRIPSPESPGPGRKHTEAARQRPEGSFITSQRRGDAHLSRGRGATTSGALAKEEDADVSNDTLDARHIDVRRSESAWQGGLRIPNPESRIPSYPESRINTPRQ
jgi:hypothetical protein